LTPHTVCRARFVACDVTTDLSGLKEKAALRRPFPSGTGDVRVWHYLKSSVTELTVLYPDRFSVPP